MYLEYKITSNDIKRGVNRRIVRVKRPVRDVVTNTIGTSEGSLVARSEDRERGNLLQIF